MFTPSLLIVIACTNYLLGLYVFLRDSRNKLNIWFGVSAFLIGSWVLENYLLYSRGSIQILIFLYIQGPFTILSGFPWVGYLVRKTFSVFEKYLFVLAAVVSSVFALISASGDSLISSFKNYSQYETGPLFGVYTIFTLSLLGGLLYYLVHNYRTASHNLKPKLQLIFFGVAIMVIVSMVVSYVLPLVEISQYNVLDSGSSIFFVIFGAYSILKHQLFDIRVIIRKIVLYSALLAVVFGVYTLIALILTSYLPVSSTISSFIAAALIAFGFEPLRQWLQATTEKYLFVKEYDADSEIKKLTETLNNVIDLDEALRQMMQTVTQALKLDRAATLLIEKDNDNDDEYSVHLDTTAGSKEGSKNIQLKARRVQEINFPAPKRLMDDSSKLIIQYLQRQPRLLMVDELAQEAESRIISNQQLRALVSQDKHQDIVNRNRAAGQLKKVADILRELKVSVVVPIMVKQKLIGALYLGEKLSNDSFYEDDLNFLSIVGGQTASAIEKARFYEEDQLKSEFVSIASHELLTPTAAIEGYLSMILDEHMAKVDKKAEDYLWKVYKSAQRLSKLVKDLLSVSRIEAGRIQIEPKVFDLTEVVQQQVDQLIMRANEAKLKLEYHRPKGEVKVFADPERVAQAVVNLVGNAIKYTKQGSITVAITDKGNLNEVTVADTGIGMKDEDRAHLFEKFHRIETQATAGIIGTGLGLYITKSIIELMGGKIWVKSTPGKGSTFGFTLPKHRAS